MPKYNVYAPDGLVERLRGLDPQANLSALFQEAVQQRLGVLADESVAPVLVTDLVRARQAISQAERVLRAVP